MRVPATQVRAAGEREGVTPRERPELVEQVGDRPKQLYEAVRE